MQVPTTLTAGRFLVAALFFVGAVLSERVASHAWAQVNPPSKQPSRAEGSGTTHVLPFPDFRFQGSVGRTIAESDPPEFPQPVRPPKGAPNIVYILIDDAGYGQFGTFGGQVPTPALDRVAADGLRYTRFHTTALVLADARGAAHRAQPPLDRQRRDHRGRDRLRRLHRHHRQERRHDRRGAAAVRLRHLVVRQEPQHARLGDQPGRPVRSLAERTRLRLLLRLHGRRHGPVAADAVREPRAGPALDRSELHPDARTWSTTRSPGCAARDRSPPTSRIFLYMSTGATHAPHHVSPEYIAKYKGQVRHGLGRLSRADVRAAEEARRRAGRTRS